MTDKARKALDALELLMQDHREIESLFSEFDHLQRGGRGETGPVTVTACAELKIHDTLETEIFYPAVSDAADDAAVESLLDEAEREHDTVLELIEKLEHTGADHKQRDAYFAIIAEHVKQHVLAEETELFPMVRKLKQLDLDALAAAMKERKARLISDMGYAEAREETV
jgi:hemerythrin superfamily protein